METVNPVDEGTPGGNDGTGSNVSVVTGLIGNALEFNGSDSNVNVGDVAELNSVERFTIAFWMNQDVIDTQDNIFRKGAVAGTRIRIIVIVAGGLLRFEVLGNVAYGALDYSAVISALQWHHVIVVFDGSLVGNSERLKVYVDGIQVSLAFTGSIPAATSNLSGSDASIGFTSGSFDGKLDDFRIYNVALTEAEVQALAAFLTPVLDSVTNDGDGETVTLTVSNVENPRTVHAFYRIAGSAVGFTESSTTRVGPGVLSLGGLEDGTTYEIQVVSSDGVASFKPSLPSNSIVFTPSLVLPASVVALEGQGGLDFQLNDDCDDIEIVNLDLALVDGTVQVRQALCIALRMFRGEWFLDGEAGVPYYQNVLVKNPDVSEINSILKVEILKVAHVNKILEFSSDYDVAARELTVSFRVDTDFGPVTVEEVL
jgi:hypothetical protein